MATSLSTLRLAALASAIAFAGIAPSAAAPLFVPGTQSRSNVVLVGDSAKVIYRDRLNRDDGAWKKKKRHFRDKRRRDRDGWDHDGRDGLYRPKDTPKFAYDADGNLRIYDRDRWDDGWDDWDGRDWDKKKKRRRPRIVKMNSFGVQEPSPELKDVLTAVPD